MKRIAGTFVLLAGLSGCISFTAQPGTGEKQSADPRAAVAPPPSGPAMGMMQPPPVTMATNPNWTAHPDHQPTYTAARPPMPYAPGTQPRPGTPVANPPRPVPYPNRALAMANPAVPTGSMQPPAPLTLPPGMPMVVTPRGEQPAERQVNYTTTLNSPEGVVHASRVEPKPRSAPKHVAAAETKTAKGGAPLMRLVNTKRITLNFEVKDVGPSGLSSVELWYTQDCREWKKYDTPTGAQAYVIEVDEEGMYGFTLVAKSGLGVGKEPPTPGEQPQVWVVVDLSTPDVQLTEISPVASGRNQQVTLGWKASDKNLGRQPISLWYAEKEDGPWKSIAANLENTGRHVWQAPTGMARMHFKVEAADLAGNVGKAVSAKPVLLDQAMPTVSITNVDSAPSN